jgi:ABC-type phosphate transport system substrate-binding protein
MMRLLLVISFAGFLSVTCAWAAEGLSVIAHSGFPVASVASDELSRIFLGKTQRLAGLAVNPVNKESGSPERSAFDQRIHHMNEEAMKQFWLAARIKGEGHPPRSLQSDAAVLRYVASVPGAIGYVRFPPAGTQVRNLAVDGVAASNDTLASGRYPLRLP